MRAICQDEVDVSECELECESLTSVGKFNFSIQSGDSLECRLYHVTAASLNATRHCPHAAGLDVCR
jgi:hypothetical protein